MKKYIQLLTLVFFTINTIAQTNTLPSTGNVGIGTTSPGTNLQVNGYSSIGDDFDPTLYGFLQLVRPGTQNDNKFHLSFIRNGYSVSGMGYVPNSNVLGIWHANNNSGIPLLAFTPDQNVGIGTSYPSEKLQLGDRFTFQDGGWKGILSNMAWCSRLNTNVRLVDAPATGMFFTDLGNIVFQNAPNAPAGTPLSDALHSMIIHNSGQVGIGTSYTKTSFSDESTRLFVEGGIRARKIRVDQLSWPDYVFHKDFKLPSLSEVEEYIQQHKHLPEVPSAEEVEKNGLDIGENQALLLKKIEELTLYLIELNEKLEAQNNLIQSQQQQIVNLKKKIIKVSK